MQLDIRHHPEQGRFEARVDGHPCVADYRLSDGTMLVTHTEVAPQLQGQGIAAQLMRTLLDYARDHGYKVRPLCSYARAYMRRHPETANLLAPA
ncbi:MAG: N-acetyltransferase [Proteobacteria bacterium]|nr:N-acetyltransferase [Pseudomonadota bacterium]